jgi:hypothetical protein
MEIFKNANQKNNVAKYCFDVSKVLLAIIVIAPLVREEASHFYLTIGGVFLALMFFLIGYLIDSKEF